MLIEGKSVCVAIDGRTIIRDETIRCGPGSITALVGASVACLKLVDGSLS